MAFKTIKKSLYGGEVELIFNPLSRNRYLVNSNGDSFSPPGVTTILSKVLAKEALMLWPLNMARNYLNNLIGTELTQEILDEACKQHTIRSDKGKDVGSEVHEAIEKTLANAKSSIQLSADAAKPFNAFMDWFAETDPKVLGTEQIVYSREHNYSGTFDALLEIDGQIVLADIKTTNASREAPLGIYPEYFLQLGAYSMAHTEQRVNEYLHGKAPQDIVVDDLMVINASKTGKLSTLRASDLGLSVKDCENAWLQVLNTYKFIEPLKKQIKEYTGQKELVL